jgi:raffinose/stachyose/melibiose transport system permease protein
MCAWMLVRSNNRLSKIIFMVFVATMLIPFQTLMMPLMQEMSGVKRNLGIPMVDTLGALVYMNIGFGASMAVFLYHGFVKSIPRSLEEAATIDGCNTFGVFWRIVFPMLKPVTVTVMVLDVIWIWNDYLLPSLVLTGKANRTIPLSTASFFGEFTIQWNMAMAGLMLTIIPVIIFYLCAQKYIIKGVAAGAVK